MSCSAVAVVQSLSCVQLFATPWTAARQASLSFTTSWSLHRFMSIESVMLTISSSPISYSSCPQSFSASESFPMSQLVLHIKWPKDWGFSFSIVFPMNIQGWFLLGLIRLISLLSVQGTLKRLLQHHNLKASIL